MSRRQECRADTTYRPHVGASDTTVNPKHTRSSLGSVFNFKFFLFYDFKADVQIYDLNPFKTSLIKMIYFDQSTPGRRDIQMA